jgi:hypothetical protein
MKQVKIRSLKHSDPAINWDFQSHAPQAKIDEIIKSETCGKSARWVLHKDEPMAEPYDDADVLEEKVESDIDGVPHKYVKLKAEYTIEIEDITAQYELEQIIAKRKAEYPTAEEFLNAYFDGGEAALTALQEKRLAIKSKYPK